MAAEATVIHRIPGRARLRVDEKRGDAAYFLHLSERLVHLDNVASAKVNPVTGSVALQFTGSLEDVLRRAKEEDLLTVAESGPGNGRAPLQALRAGWTMPQALPSIARKKEPINLVSGRDINRDFMMGSMLLVVGLLQMLRGQWFPPAFSMLWYAREAFDLANGQR